MRAKNASDIAISDSASTLRGTRSPIQSFEKVSTAADAPRFGDLLGTRLYDHYGGFDVCVLAITIVYALILPVILLVPSELIATADEGVKGP